MALKHVGRIKKTKKKLVVAYRVLPSEPDQCLVIPTEALTADEHDALMKAVESPAGQQAYELAEALHRAQLPDGRNMLVGFHTTGRMRKMAQADVEMVPDSKTTIGLDELNRVIAEQRGVTVEELALQSKKPKNDLTVEEHNLDVEPGTPAEVVQAAQAATDEVMSDEDLAAKYRSDADRLYKEAKRLREQAEELVPTKRKSKSKESAKG